MLSINEIDLKTGALLLETIEGNRQPKEKIIEHSYLEHWLVVHQIEAQFFFGKFYGSVVDADRLRLESEDKVLVFTNGKDGYFTDPVTAQLLIMGDADRGLSPIYSSDRNSPHNFVAYGSLVASDGIAATAISRGARILIIDDEARSHGVERLLDRNGQAVPPEQLEKLYDKMGDGTMLIAQQVMQQLILPKEREDIATKVFEKSGISADISNLAGDYPELLQALEDVERQTIALVQRTVTQFRAASTDLPGIIKGTMSTSQWCERLGVDAIISKNDIKGDDGRLSTPGLKEVSDFWVNRKSDGQYGEQAVGPQVKGCIPEATLHEFNPRMVAQAEELAAAINDPDKLAHYYLSKKESHRTITQNDEGEEVESRPDWLYDILKADKFGQLKQFSKINYELSRYIRGEWVDNALRGVYVPSAMAQHHSQLKPWEVCNKDLPHGAIVAYYRSPFPNVGAAAIAINNTDIIKDQDREAFSKNGVAYLPPWTAKNVAITDFDRDANGYFVGYTATVPDLPQQIRAQLESVADLPPAAQYEAGRSLFQQMVQQLEAGQEDRITAATKDYPLAVREFIERNAPDQKPPEIAKQKKENHPWQDNEPHAAATWRAWKITADNPTGMVANAGMVLQSLALEIRYATSPAKRESLLQQISGHYIRLLKLASEGKLVIPLDESLQNQIREIAHSRQGLQQLRNFQDRQAFVDAKLKGVYQLLMHIVDGPNATNLQTAVDTAKSSKGIDKEIQELVQKLAHKPHQLRQHHKDPNNFLAGKGLPTNTQEPIGWGVEAVNRAYRDSQLTELRNEAFRDLLPNKNYTLAQEAKALLIVNTYNNLVREALEVQEKLREKRPETKQPSLTVTSVIGRELIIQGIKDSEGRLPIWRAQGKQSDWEILVNQGQKEGLINTMLIYPDALGKNQEVPLGQVALESIEKHQLVSLLEKHNGEFSIAAPTVQVKPPISIDNDIDERLKEARYYLKNAIAQIPQEERMAYASALWRHSEGMGVVLKAFTPEVVQQLQHIPSITLTGIQYPNNEVGQIPPGEYTVRFSQYSYVDKQGVTKTPPSIAILTNDGKELQFGALDPRSIHLPIGTTVKAHLEIEPSGKIARMQVLDRVTAPEQNTSQINNERGDVVEGFAKGQQLEVTQEDTIERSPHAQPSTLESVHPIGKPVQMVFPLKLHGELNPLPVATCIEAMRGYGRCHTTRTFEPYAAYGFNQGDIAIAYSDQQQVAFRVGEQYRITPAMMADPSYQQQWAAMEKHSTRELQSFEGKVAWGLKMEPLGDYVNGTIQPFPNRTTEIYSPSRQELRQWCAIAMIGKNQPLQEYVTVLGTQLKALYGAEVGMPGATPPMDYRHPAVVISESDRQRMQQSIEAVKSIVHSPSQPLQPSHLEIG